MTTVRSLAWCEKYGDGEFLGNSICRNDYSKGDASWLSRDMRAVS